MATDAAGPEDTVVIVTGAVLARQESLDEMLAASLEHVRRSRLEPGCLAHGVHRDVEEPLRLVFLERWADLDALRAHFAVPASRAFAAALRELAAEPPTMAIFQASATRP
jgi:quinol monooxygenase YgiN